MATGLRVRDPNSGRIVMDTSYRAGRVLDTIFFTANSGNSFNAGLSQGELFYRIGATNNTAVYPDTNILAQLNSLSVYKSGQYIYWSIGWGPNQALPPGYVWALMFGVY
ncbi:hypothetical protein AVV28_gp28 [Achromobacter phage JWX]|uniref:Uncharacterized protein n=1 Tax=Achromobacter phage JWX TaxID=1589746 RepID=A0A0B5A4A2_9CAUD|nr:hypothetical protein AVV28_gp28 [Achromobacter phage JWX]AJD82794.1 hypothetical protein JWX_00028 [Achromobacter phage JWX]